MIVTTTEKMEMKCGENLHTDNIVSKAAMTDVIFPSLFNAVTLSRICKCRLLVLQEYNQSNLA